MHGTANSAGTRVRVALTGGVKSVSPTLVAGKYELKTPDSVAYRIEGDTTINVAEEWI